MKPSFLALLLWLGCLVATSFAQTVSIPAMTWTPRSDWVNVVTTYGADPSGVNDSTAAIQQALSAVKPPNTFNTKNAVYFPAGTYKISSTLQVNNWGGGMLVGCGKNTTLRWYGALGQPMMTTNGVSQVRFLGFIWDGNNLASCGVQHMPQGPAGQDPYEFHNRHENEEFLNFTQNGTDLAGSSMPAGGIVAGANPNHNAPTAETMVWNCLFYNCTNGIIVGYEVYNDDMWSIQNCEFENCPIGVNTLFGMCLIIDDHFQNSATCDVYGGHGAERIRHCTSMNSGALYTEGLTAESQSQVIEDCWVDSWTSTYGAVQFANSGPSSVVDCNFTHAPAGTVSVIAQNGAGSTSDISISNNYYSPKFTSAVHSYGGSLKLITIPPGNGSGQLTSPTQKFLVSTPFVDSTNIVDLSKPPYSVDLTGNTDATNAVQNGINAVKAANNGSILYFPIGYYRLSSGLTASGGNYTLQGEGSISQLVDFAPAGTAMLTITNPSNLSIQQLDFLCAGSTSPAMLVTSSGTGSLYLDGTSTKTLYTGNWGASGADTGPGIQFNSLPAGFTVSGLDVPGNFTVNDCGPATILTRFLINTGMTVEGSTQAKTGYLGTDILEGMQQVSPTAFNVTITDNQDMVIGDRYTEQGDGGDFQLLRGAATWPGHVVLTSFNSALGVNGQSHTASPTLYANNYLGTFFFAGGGLGQGTPPIQLTQTGSNAFQMLFLDNYFATGSPTVSGGSGLSAIIANAIGGTNYNPPQLPDSPNPLTSVNLTTLAQGYDFYRSLGKIEFANNLNIAQIIPDPSMELDTVNPHPTTVLGYVPAGWVPANTMATASGVRNLTTQSGGSPFGTGSKSMLWEDTTANSSGSALTAACAVPATNPNLPAIETFDFKVGNSPSVGCDFWIGSACGYDYGADLHIQAGGTTVNILANVNGTETLLTTLSVNTWYRVQVQMLAPSAGPSSATVYITPWNKSANAPGTTLSYTINGTYYQEPFGFTGFNIYSQTAPGNYQSVSFDNLSIVTNGILTLPSP